MITKFVGPLQYFGLLVNDAESGL